MISELILFFISMLVSGVILVLLPQIRSLGLRDRRMKAFFPMGVITTIWIVLNAVTMVINPVYFAFVYSAKVIFVTLMVYVSIWFFMNFTESKVTNSRLFKASFIMIPVLDILANVTNPLHWLYFVAYDYPIANKGVIFYVHIFLIIFAILFSIAIISVYVVRNSRQYPLLFLTALGVITPFILNMLFSFNLIKFEQDLSPIGYFFTIIVFLYFANVTRTDTTKKLSQALAVITKTPALALGIIEDSARIIVQEGCRALSKEAIRLGIWYISEDTTIIKNITYYDISTGKHSVQDDFDLSGCPEYLQLLKSERVIPISDTRIPNPLSPCLNNYGPNICALLDAPIRVGGKLVGVVCIEQDRCRDFPGKREWTAEEQNFVSSLADFMTIAITGKEATEKTITLSAIFDSAPDLMYCKDLHSIHTECNKAMVNFFNVPKDHLIGKDDTEAFGWSAEKAAFHMSADSKVFNERQPVTMEECISASDGTVFFFETIKTPLIQGGKITGLVGMARDITRRKAAEEELNRQHSLMDTVNAAAAVLLAPDTDGGDKAINRSMEMICQSVGADRVFLWKNVVKDDGSLHYKQLFKWTCPECEVKDHYPEYSYDVVMPEWKNLLFEGKSINGPLDTLPGYDPVTFSIYEMESILIVPLFLKGEYWGFISFDDCHKRRHFPEADEHILRSWGLLVVGATQRAQIMKDLEQAVAKAKKASSEAMRSYAEAETALKVKSRFIANMNHEMRTPMNVIVGFSDLMLEEKEVSDEVRGAMEKINIAGNTLMGLINDVLDFSKVESGKMDLMPEQYGVASLLNDIIALNSIRAEDKPIVFKLDINENMPARLFGDDLRIKQILNNLLSNAFKYTKKGSITLGVSCQRESVSSKDVWFSIYVSDTGIGIREEDIEKLFTDYNQVDTKANRKIEGTGLGLSITKKLVELMDGEILVESEYGKGTVFRVRIRQGFVSDSPIGKEIVESLGSFRYSDVKKQAQKKLVRSDLSYARVLVVDDFPANLDVTTGMLRKYKIQVDCVDNGQSAIDCIAMGLPVYDAIFMDHMMPGMDGVEATQKIRALGTKYAKDLPIIALTANAVAGNEQMFLDNGFNAFLPKPFNVMSLDSVVQKWIRKNEE